MLACPVRDPQIKLFTQILKLEWAICVFQFGRIEHMQGLVTSGAFISAPRLFATPALSMLAVGGERDNGKWARQDHVNLFTLACLNSIIRRLCRFWPYPLR
jgi:hypothetical protein